MVNKISFALSIVVIALLPYFLYTNIGKGNGLLLEGSYFLSFILYGSFFSSVINLYTVIKRQTATN